MLIQPIDYFLLVWFVLAAGSTLYVAFDQFRNNPEPTVMQWGFILVTLYMGPLGLLLYVLADKEPRPGTHEAFIQPLWKQGVGSTIHCIAGDATGIISAAVITASLGLPMKIDLIVEYLAGFSFGLFIFQSLFMKNMMGGTYWENVKRSFLPEFISMNFMMAAMAPVMSLLMMGRDMRAMEPTQLLFWGIMSLGVTAGFLMAYPVNVWMVSKGIKHGLMTERKPGTKFAADSPTNGSHKAMEHSDSAKSGDGKHAGHDPNPDGAQKITLPQKAAVAMFSMCVLAVGMISPANFVNMSLSARDVGGLVMPKGMIMDRDTPAAAMRDMSFVDPALHSGDFAVTERGDRSLSPIEENGVKSFHLEASVIRWHILPNVAVDAYAYNQQIPGPRLHFRQGDHVRIVVHNRLPEATTVHWHGLIVPNQMDGPGDITQKPIQPGGTYNYEFTAVQAGTYFYHPHYAPDRQQSLGLYGAIVIDPADPAKEVKADHEYVIQLQEWLKREGLTYPAMFMEGGLANYFTINGKAYPSTDTIRMKVGETLKVRFIGTNNNFVHPMHIHGGPFTVVARDGETIPESARFLADTVSIGPGQRYDVIWPARKPGKWLIHCHIPHHTANNNVEEHGGGGLMLVIQVE